jgi:hypothetical protein
VFSCYCGRLYLLCNMDLWHAVHAHRAPCPRPCAPFFFLFKAFPSFGSPFKLALLGLHPKEPVNGKTRTMLIIVFVNEEGA